MSLRAGSFPQSRGDWSGIPGEKISKDLIDLGTQIQIYK